MPTQAYVFIYVMSGRVEGVAKEVAQLHGVKSAHMCWGRPDVIAFIEVATPTWSDSRRLRLTGKTIYFRRGGAQKWRTKYQSRL